MTCPPFPPSLSLSATLTLANSQTLLLCDYSSFSESYPANELPLDDFFHGGAFMSDFHDIPSLERPCYQEMKRFIDQEGANLTLTGRNCGQAHWYRFTQTLSEYVFMDCIRGQVLCEGCWLSCLLADGLDRQTIVKELPTLALLYCIYKPHKIDRPPTALLMGGGCVRSWICSVPLIFFFMFCSESFDETPPRMRYYGGP